MEKAVDLRIQKTRKALTEALMQLLAKKSYADVTINELCNTAMVRRATFYKHFGDKDDFFAYVVREKIASHLGDFQGDPARPKEYILRMAACVLELLKENWAQVQVQRRSGVYSTLQEIISQEIAWDVQHYLCQVKKSGIFLPIDPPELMAQLLVGSLASMCVWWIEKNQPIPEDELVEKLSDFVLRL